MHILGGHRQPLQALAYSPDGRRLAAGCDDGSVALWDVQAGDVDLALRVPRDHQTNRAPAAILCLAFSPNGRWLATGCHDGTVRVWDLVAGSATGEDALDGRGVSGLTFSPDGAWLIAGIDLGPYKGRPSLWMWAVEEDGVDFSMRQLRAERELRPWNLASSVWSLAHAPDGKTLVVGASNGDVQFWDLNARDEPVRVLPHGTASRALAVSPDGNTLAALPGNLVELRHLKNLDAPPRLIATDGITLSSLAFTPDSRMLATGGWDSTVRLWDVPTGREVRRFDWQIGRINAVAVAPDGMTAAAAGPQSCDIVLFDLDV